MTSSPVTPKSRSQQRTSSTSASAKRGITQSASLKVVELREFEQVNEATYLAHRMYEECADPSVPFSFRATTDNITRYVVDWQRANYNVWIAYLNGRAIGMAVGTITPYIFNTERAARLDIWYVDKQSRTTKAALLLLREFEEWARLNGCIQLFGGPTGVTGEQADKVASIMTKLGFDQTGPRFMKSLIASRH